MKCKKVLGLILGMLIITSYVFCAPTLLPFHNQQKVEYEKKEGCQYSFLQTRNGDTRIIEHDPAQIEDIIVEFEENPYFIDQKYHPDSQKEQSFYTNRFDEFENDVTNLYEKIARHQKSPLPQPEFSEGIYRVFFGINVKVPRIMMSDLQDLPYVKTLHMNKQYSADLFDSVPLIQADSVWYNYGTMGDSIVVGVLDTGIDYTHPYLGGSFGPGFKVIDGYDYVNMDNDPIDDNGHGTHVAGIIAADGDSLKGVAPHALLMAFKVLNENGSGYEYQIMNGIDRALDPNMDGDYSDKVDVINMSLGGSGDPDDALSIAVDRATMLGVISCISAGNSYTWKRIRSPGTARTALTVGSTDKSDEMSYFSSKGPNTKIFTLKPEVVAPGENIYSLALNNGFTYLSGTSMAAPHVAGVCALLKSLHPEWTPEKIKSAIMLSAKDINAHVMEQGCGRVNAYNASEIDIFAIPACASFGLDDFSQNIWSKTESVKIINESDIIQNFMILFNGIQTGITLSANPQFFSLAPNDSTTVLVTLTVDNSCIALPDTLPSVYDGTISISGTDRNLKLPWTFVVQARVGVMFNRPRADFVFHNENVCFFSIYATQLGYYYYELELPFGIYDLYADIYFADEMFGIFREDIDISTDVYIEINTDEAENLFQLAAVDEQGNLLSSFDNSSTLLVLKAPEESKLFSCGYSGFSNTWHTSDVSNDYTIICAENHFDIDNENIMHIVNHDVVHGISGDINLTNNPSDLYIKYLSLAFPPGIHSPYINIGNFTKYAYPGHMIEFGGWSGGTIKQVTTNTDFIWSIPIYYNSSTYEYVKSGLNLFGHENDDIFDDAKTWFRTMPIYAIGDNIASYIFCSNPSTYIPVNEDTLHFGEGLVYPYLYFSKNDDHMVIYDPPNCNFCGSLDEIRERDSFESPFSLYSHNGAIITSGMLNEALDKIQYLNLNNELYNFETINSSYYIAGYNGTATGNFFFDMSQEDATPPQLTSYKLFDHNGCVTQKLSTNENSLLQFSVIDWKIVGPYWGYDFTYKEVILDSTHLHYKEHGTDVWYEVPVVTVVQDSMIGWLYEAEVTPLTNYDSTAIDLKLSFRDDSGNKTIWQMEPAFAVGNFQVAVDEKIPDGCETELITLYSNYPNPFFSSTKIHFSILKPATSAKIRIYNIKGELVRTIAKDSFEKGYHFIEWDGLNMYEKEVSNGIYFYTLQIDDDKLSPKKMILLR